MGVIKYSFDVCKIEALKYNTRNEFRLNNNKIYKYAWKNNWLDNICSHMNKPIKELKWTKEECHIEALKYQTITEFQNNCFKIYSFSIKYGWKDSICSHMKRKIKIPKWNKENCHIEALKHNTRKDFRLNNQTVYQFARKNNWLDDICSHMIIKFKIPKWTKEECYNEALKFNTRNQFRKNNRNIYNCAWVNNWLNDICSHMPINVIFKWSKEECQKEALKFNTRSKFSLYSSSCYSISIKNGWLNDICSHMIKPNTLLYDRIIYVYKFSDNSVYIGLTKNFKIRERNRRKNKNDSVTKHIIKTKLIPEVIFLTEFIPALEAQKLEQFYIDKYRSEGYIILNKYKGGSLGGYKPHNIVEHL